MFQYLMQIYLQYHKVISEILTFVYFSFINNYKPNSSYPSNQLFYQLNSVINIQLNYQLLKFCIAPKVIRYAVNFFVSIEIFTIKINFAIWKHAQAINIMWLFVVIVRDERRLTWLIIIYVILPFQLHSLINCILFNY